MTDQYGALSCMAQMDNAASNEAIRKFYDQWNENSLVFNRFKSSPIRVLASPDN